MPPANADTGSATRNAALQVRQGVRRRVTGPGRTLPLLRWRRGGVRRMMDARLEFPSGRRLHVGVFVVPIVLDLVLVSSQPNHQHVDLSLRALGRRVDDVVDVHVMNALADPACARAAIWSSA